MSLIIPNELKGFHKTFEKLSYMHDTMDVFDTFLEWVMWNFCADGSLNWDSGKKFPKKERPLFETLFREWVMAMSEKVCADGQWYDLFGTYYEAYAASKSRRDCKGQFFTPPNVCDFMAKIVGQNEYGIFNDPCCGSGRFPLAYHAHNLGNFLFVSDLDRTCCMMTVCNFIIHGVVGEVVWQDSLDPESWYGGWRVNANLNNPFHQHFGCPHVETLLQENSRIWKVNHACKQMSETVTILSSTRTEGQLTLF